MEGRFLEIFNDGIVIELEQSNVLEVFTFKTAGLSALAMIFFGS